MAVKRKSDSGKPATADITALDHFKTVLLGGLGIDPEGTQTDRHKYVQDPVGWVRDRLGEHLWSKQRDIIESVRDNRLTAVRSCHSSGKALAIDTPLPTPTGWTTMGEVSVGDYLLDENGRPTRVVGATEIHEEDSYRIVFSDHTEIIAAGNHLWDVLDLKSRPRKIHDWREHWGSTRTIATRALAEFSKTDSNQPRWRVPSAQALQTNEPWSVGLRPYTYGAWIGDGTTKRADITASIVDVPHFEREFRAEGYDVRLVQNNQRPNVYRIALTMNPYVDSPARKTGGAKCIPQSVLRASEEDRWTMLQGWMDTDGNTVKNSAGVELTTMSESLAASAFELVASLGLVPRLREKPAKLNGRTVGTVYTIAFAPHKCPFRLKRKVIPWTRAFNKTAAKSRSTQRTMMSIEPVGIKSVRCVEVDSPRHLYLAGESMIPTHNSYLASRLAAWWIETHTPGEAFVVTTATTASQVAVVLWREIGRVHAKGNLSGRVTLNNKWYIPTRHGNEEVVAIGIKPKDYDPTALHGIHARYVLVILDEAAGIAEPLWTAADSLASGADCRMLAIGNPDFPVGEFVECFGPRSSWNKIHISAFDTPNFTGEEVPDELRHVLASKVWQEEKLLKWGADNPIYQSKVLGEFPIVNENGLIPVKWIEDARARTLEPTGPNVLGVDVGGGTDRSVIAQRIGPVVRIKQGWATSNPDTMQTLGLLMQVLNETQAEIAHVDAVGIGQGVVDRAYDISTDQREKSKSRKARAGKVRGVKVGSSPKDLESFVNLRAEAYWGLRERFQEGQMDLDPSDEDLAAELADLRFKRTSRGQIQVESKEDMRRRGKPSPDRADAVMLAFCDPNVTRKKTRATWGRSLKERVPGSVITNISRARPPRPGRSGVR